MREHPTKCGSSNDLYSDNSGTSLSVVGRDFCLIAADTRHSAEYNINTRRATKIFPVQGMVLTTTGFYADCRSVYESLKYEVEQYEYKFGRRIGVTQAAAILHILLYSNRFFPKYAYCCLSGITEEGEPKLFSYDPVGSYGETKCQCIGSGMKMVQPLLDSWLKRKNWNCEEGSKYECTKEDALALARDVFSGAAEADVRTGDALEVYLIAADGITREEYGLRED